MLYEYKSGKPHLTLVSGKRITVPIRVKLAPAQNGLGNSYYVWCRDRQDMDGLKDFMWHAACYEWAVNQDADRVDAGSLFVSENVESLPSSAFRKILELLALRDIGQPT